MKDKLIIFVTMSLWDEPHRGRHHYANLLADNNTIIWLNRPLTWRESKGKRAELEHINRGLYVLHAGRSLLPSRIDYRLNLNNYFRLQFLLKVLKKKGFNRKPDIIWIYDYKALNFASFFNDFSKTIYFCNDYFGEYAYSKYEAKLATKVEYVFCTAPKLKDRLVKFNQKCAFLPHGTWFPKEIKEFQKKAHPESIGYIGTLNNFVDVDFLWKILNQTDFQLILGGPVIECNAEKRENFTKLFEHERVNYLGEIKRDNLFHFLEIIDVCLISNICDFNGKHRFAIKYFEYLSAGKPIVATHYFDWPEPYGKFVHIYRNNNKLEDFLYSVYSQWNKEIFDAARSLASKSTWAHRIKQISQDISEE